MKITIEFNSKRIKKIQAKLDNEEKLSEAYYNIEKETSELWNAEVKKTTQLEEEKEELIKTNKQLLEIIKSFEKKSNKNNHNYKEKKY